MRKTSWTFSTYFGWKIRSLLANCKSPLGNWSFMGLTLLFPISWFKLEALLPEHDQIGSAESPAPGVDFVCLICLTFTSASCYSSHQPLHQSPFLRRSILYQLGCLLLQVTETPTQTGKNKEGMFSVRKQKVGVKRSGSKHGTSEFWRCFSRFLLGQLSSACGTLLQADSNMVTKAPGILCRWNNIQQKMGVVSSHVSYFLGSSTEFHHWQGKYGFTMISFD